MTAANDGDIMTTYRQWLANQARVYDEIRDAGRGVTRFVSDPMAARHRAGYLVAYRYARDVEDEIARIADWYGGYLPLQKFGPGSAHSTILDWGVQDDGIDFEAEASRAIFRQLADGVQRGIAEAINRGSADAVILYDEILHRETTVVTRGIPNRALWNISDAIFRRCRETMGVRRGWGAHITVARMTAEKELPKPLEALRCALGEVRPVAVVVGTLDPRKNELLCYERFDLNW